MFILIFALSVMLLMLLGFGGVIFYYCHTLDRKTKKETSQIENIDYKDRWLNAVDLLVGEGRITEEERRQLFLAAKNSEMKPVTAEPQSTSWPAALRTPYDDDSSWPTYPPQQEVRNIFQPEARQTPNTVTEEQLAEMDMYNRAALHLQMARMGYTPIISTQPIAASRTEKKLSAEVSRMQEEATRALLLPNNVTILHHPPKSTRGGDLQ